MFAEIIRQNRLKKPLKEIDVGFDLMIADDPETLSAFLRASARGFADMQANPEEALRILLVQSWQHRSGRRWCSGGMPRGSCAESLQRSS